MSLDNRMLKSIIGPSPCRRYVRYRLTVVAPEQCSWYCRMSSGIHVRRISCIGGVPGTGRTEASCWKGERMVPARRIGLTEKRFHRSVAFFGKSFLRVPRYFSPSIELYVEGGEYFRDERVKNALFLTREGKLFRQNNREKNWRGFFERTREKSCARRFGHRPCSNPGIWNPLKVPRKQAKNFRKSLAYFEGTFKGQWIPDFFTCYLEPLVILRHSVSFVVE